MVLETLRTLKYQEMIGTTPIYFTFYTSAPVLIPPLHPLLSPPIHSINPLTLQKRSLTDMSLTIFTFAVFQESKHET